MKEEEGRMEGMNVPGGPSVASDCGCPFSEVREGYTTLKVVKERRG